MEQYAAPHQAPAEGEIESGQVVAITDLGVVVNLGGKTEGLIPAQEFAELDGPFPCWSASRSKSSAPAIARKVCCAVLPAREGGAARGPRLKRPTARSPTSPGKSWTTSRAAWWWTSACAHFCRPRRPICIRCATSTNGRAANSTVRVLKMNRKRGNVVVSRRAILDEQVASQRQGHARIDGRGTDRARRR